MPTFSEVLTYVHMSYSSLPGGSVLYYRIRRFSSPVPNIWKHRPSPDREAAASRAASARALFDGAANPFPRPPQHKVLVREMLSGVGTGATTPPRLSELEAVAAEKASATISATTEPKTATQKAA